LDLGQFDCSGDLFSRQLLILTRHFGPHQGHLSLLLPLNGFIHLQKLSLVLFEHLIDISLVHVSQDFSLLFGQLFGHHFFLLLPESFHEILLISLDLIFPVKHAALSFHQLLHLLFFGTLHFLHASISVFICFASENLKFLLSIIKLYSQILSHLIALIHLLHHLVE